MPDGAPTLRTPTIAALISGGGRTVLNVQDAIDNHELDARIAVVIASSPTVTGLQRCTERGLPTIALNHQESRFDDQLSAALSEVRPDLICLCGYLRHLRIEPWMTRRVINIHPSLLPAYGGKGMFGNHVHRAVLDRGDRVSGCTVHFVDDVYDHGPTILQRTIDVHDDDTVASLASRVFDQECIALPEAIRLVLGATPSAKP
jgi:phosphoribosylglycinamide formyltransferase-1